MADVLGVDAGWSDMAFHAVEHALDQIIVVLVAIGLQVEIGGHLCQPLVADAS